MEQRAGLKNGYPFSYMAIMKVRERKKRLEV